MRGHDGWGEMWGGRRVQPTVDRGLGRILDQALLHLDRAEYGPLAERAASSPRLHRRL